MKFPSALVAGAVLVSVLATGCSDAEEFRQECAAAGGTVETEREKKTRIKTVNGKRTTETYYATDHDCVDADGEEILDD